MENYFTSGCLLSFTLLNEEVSKWFSIAVVIITILLFALIYTHRFLSTKISIEIDSIAGFAYDDIQNIFYSEKNAWQRHLGYCRLYDELAIKGSMAIYCEPLYLEYEGKKWLIELWKGQYGIMTGCEVGVYTSIDEDIDIPGVFSGTFYPYTLDEDNLNIKIVLIKNSELVFEREDRHWWLNGFVFCEYSEPNELSMHVSIELKSKTMCDLFVEALKEAGYSDFEIFTDQNTVHFVFDRPRTPQPKNQKGLLAIITQEKNLLMCRTAKYITKDILCTNDKLRYLYIRVPWLCSAEKVIGTEKTNKKYTGIKKTFDQRR